MRKFDYPEGATLIADCSGLIPTWVQSLHDLNRVEAENIAKAQKRYLKRPIPNPVTWFQIKNLKTIHRDMFCDVWDWAGSFRKSVTSIGIKPGFIPYQLAELCNEVIFWSQSLIEHSFLETAARIHHRLVFIHPFENGNGRFSRLVADRWLIAQDCIHPVWPDELHRDGTGRKEYLTVLREADKGNYSPLVSFMEQLGAKSPLAYTTIK